MSEDIRDAIFNEIYMIVSQDKDAIVLSADADAFGLRKIKKDFPDRFFNMGVAEQNMVAVASGLALSGKKVFICAIAPFITFRCFEQIKVMICSMNLPVFIIGMGIGLSFDFDGPTHHSICDIGVMSNLPEMSIYNPIDETTAQFSINRAYHSLSPSYIRVDKGVFDAFGYNKEELDIGFKVIKENKSNKCILISTGICSHYLTQIRKEINFIDIFKIKPFPKKEIIKYLSEFDNVITFEEHVINSGIGDIMSNLIVDNDLKISLYKIALPEEQIFEYGTREYLHSQYGITKEKVECLLNE